MNKYLKRGLVFSASALLLFTTGIAVNSHPNTNIHADEASEILAWGNSSKDPAVEFDKKDKASQDKSLAKTYKTYTYDANFYKHEPKLTNQNQYNKKYWKSVDKREHEHNHKHYRRVRINKNNKFNKHNRRKSSHKYHKNTRRIRKSVKRPTRKLTYRQRKQVNKDKSLIKKYNRSLKRSHKRSTKRYYVKLIKQINNQIKRI